MIEWFHVTLVGSLCIIGGYYLGYIDAMHYCTKKLDELTK